MSLRIETLGERRILPLGRRVVETLVMWFLKSARRRSVYVVGALAGLGFLMTGALWQRTQAQPSDVTTEIAPGLTLRSVQTQTVQGPLTYWVVKADGAKFDLGIEIPDQTSAVKKRNVVGLAAQSGALVAVNGGFFAYGGAAVGAVKQNGNWQRLPWKRRTALGWNSASDAQVGPLGGGCQLQIATGDGKVKQFDASLNGFTLPGQRVEFIDGFAVLTSQFARKYTLRTGEIAFRNGAPAQTSGDVDLTTGGFCAIGRGASAQGIALDTTTKFSYTVRTSPDWGRYAQILGAGPRLVQKGVAYTTEGEEEFRPDVVARGPRTCVGWDKAHNWMLLVADGRSLASVGLTIPEVAQLFQTLGAVEAMNLDGGSSTQLVVNGALINAPSGFDPVNPTRHREVQVSNALTLKAK